MTQPKSFEVTLDEDYAAFVDGKAKTGEAIRSSLTTQNAHLLHMVVGVCGEAGELIDAVKKVAIYGKAIDRAHVVEELGDIEFYLQGLRNELGIARRECLLANVIKLDQRYSSGTYSDAEAQMRLDKIE